MIIFKKYSNENHLTSTVGLFTRVNYPPSPLKNQQHAKFITSVIIQEFIYCSHAKVLLLKNYREADKEGGGKERKS